MHAYITHLLEDIAAGHQTQRSEVRSLGSPDLTGVVSEFERLRQEPGHTLGYYSGLSAGDFPPADQLRNKEMQEMCKALRKMMRSWDLRYSLPKALPVRVMYKLLIKALERRIDLESSFSVLFAYCTREPGCCPLEKYCTCLKRKKKEISPSGRSDGSGFIEIRI